MKPYNSTPRNDIKSGDRVAIHNVITGDVSFFATVCEISMDKNGNVYVANIIKDGGTVKISNTLESALCVI